MNLRPSESRRAVWKSSEDNGRYFGGEIGGYLPRVLDQDLKSRQFVV